MLKCGSGYPNKKCLDSHNCVTCINKHLSFYSPTCSDCRTKCCQYSKDDNMISEKYKQKIQAKSTSDLIQLKQIIEYELETRSEEELIKNPIYRQMITQGKV